MSASASDPAHMRAWRVRRTLFQMLRARGYLVDDDDHDMTFDDFRTQFPHAGSDAEGDTIKVEKLDDPTVQLFVFFPECAKAVGVDTVKNFIKRMKVRGGLGSRV
jgi:hypothetical protein